MPRLTRSWARMLYFSALHAERLRQETFQKKELSRRFAAIPNDRGGTLNGKPFESFEDADPRVGARLEVYAAGRLSVDSAGARRIDRDGSSQAAARSAVGSGAGAHRSRFQRHGTGRGAVAGAGSVFVRSAADDNIRLGRATEWAEVDGQAVPFGQRVFDVDGEEVPILEIRKIEFMPAAQAAS